jgi:hypothetical protein
VSDRIQLGVFGDAAMLRAAEEHRAYILAETLALELALAAEPSAGWSDHVQQVNMDGVALQIGVRRA